ncbi:MAG: DMT family transporter [Spirochaetes bacterium]|nr:DMT family transporter [Spirochaetota bacterium]
MNTLVFLLVIFAAFTHALWNFFSKKVSGNFTIFWYGNVIAHFFLAGYTIYYLATTGFDFRATHYLIISIITHALYYVFLLYLYSRGDISTVYPIARGTGVAGTAILASLLLKEIITTGAVFGIAAVCFGIFLIGLSKNKNQTRDIKSYFFAILTGIWIVLYSISDKQGVQYINPIAYINIMDFFAFGALTGLANKNGFANSIKVVKKHFKETLIIGFGSVGTYLIILFAMTLERASYIVSVREFSVVIASILGFIFLKEKATPFKIFGIVCVTAGLILIKMG